MITESDLLQYVSADSNGNKYIQLKFYNGILDLIRKMTDRYIWLPEDLFSYLSGVPEGSVFTFEIRSLKEGKKTVHKFLKEILKKYDKLSKK